MVLVRRSSVAKLRDRLAILVKKEATLKPSPKNKNKKKPIKNMKQPWRPFEFADHNLLAEFQKEGGVAFEVMDGDDVGIFGASENGGLKRLEVINPEKKLNPNNKRQKTVSKTVEGLKQDSERSLKKAKTEAAITPEEQLAALKLKKSKKRLSAVQTAEMKRLSAVVGAEKEKKKLAAAENLSPVSKKIKTTSSEPPLKELKESVLPELPLWDAFPLSPVILRNLRQLKFFSPSLVQSACLLPALHNKDLVVAAETGSGKTLAFGLPLMQRALDRRASCVADKHSRQLQSLVLLPTRELAEQVKKHLEAVVQTRLSDSAEGSGRMVACCVGGLSLDKQVRVLERGRPEVVVGTPGRLAQLSSLVVGGDGGSNASVSEFLRSGLEKHLETLVLDEADRLVEKGHFRDLTKILDFIYKGREGRVFEAEEEEATVDKGDTEGEKKISKPIASNSRKPLQTMVFSATLATEGETEGMQSLLEKVHLRSGGALRTIDLTKERARIGLGEKNEKDLGSTSGQLPTTLTVEELVFPKESEREPLLCHYLLTQVLGDKRSGTTQKAIIFTNAISSVHRLASILTVLLGSRESSKKLAQLGKSTSSSESAPVRCDVLSLHSGMPQRDRMKKLDRFRRVVEKDEDSRPDAQILICTDVAARGVDVPDVGFVIHYQVPRDAETFVHRTGRTARAGRTGRVLLLQAPEDASTWGRLRKQVFGENDGRLREALNPLGTRGFNANLRPAVEACVDLEKDLHKREKIDAEKRWFQKVGEECDLDVDHIVGGEEGEEKEEFSKAEKARLAGIYNGVQVKLRNYVKNFFVNSRK